MNIDLGLRLFLLLLFDLLPLLSRRDADDAVSGLIQVRPDYKTSFRLSMRQKENNSRLAEANKMVLQYSNDHNPSWPVRVFLKSVQSVVWSPDLERIHPLLHSVVRVLIKLLLSLSFRLPDSTSRRSAPLPWPLGATTAASRLHPRRFGFFTFLLLPQVGQRIPLPFADRPCEGTIGRRVHSQIEVPSAMAPHCSRRTQLFRLK